MSNPYLETPIRARMYSNSTQRVLWSLVPFCTFTLFAALPFIIAAKKGVTSWAPAIAYGSFTVIVVFFGQLFPNPGNWIGGAMVMCMIVATIHTALLDSDFKNGR